MGLSYYGYIWMSHDLDLSKIPQGAIRLENNYGECVDGEWRLVREDENGRFFILQNGYSDDIPGPVKRGSEWFNWTTQEGVLGHFQCITVVDAPYPEESIPSLHDKCEDGSYIDPQALRWRSFAHATEEVENCRGCRFLPCRCGDDN